MYSNDNNNRPNSAICDTISLPNKSGGTRIEILNALIKALREAQLDIQNVAVFEHPLEAVVQIRNSGQFRQKQSLFEKLSKLRGRKTPPIFLKLGVERRPSTESPFLLKYEILPRKI